MTKDDIIQMAKQAKLPYYWATEIPCNLERLEKFADLVAEKIKSQSSDAAWLTLVKHRDIGWEIRKEVTDAIHAKGEQ